MLLAVALDIQPNVLLITGLAAVPFAAFAPVVRPSKSAKFGAVVAITIWCVLTALSFGVLYVPALVVSLIALADGGAQAF